LPLPGSPGQGAAAPSFRGGATRGEFEEQEAVLIGCAQLIRNFPQVYINLVRSIYRQIRVICLVNEADESLGRVLLSAAGLPHGSVEFLRLPHISMWARDWCPISVFDREGQRRMLGFELRHLRTSADTGIRPELERLFGEPVLDVPLTHEGGNILFNGAGICLTSTTVFPKNAGRGYEGKQIGEVLATYFGATQWAYLDPLSGETTGHIDQFCVFVDANTVVVGQFDPRHDAVNAEVLDRAAAMIATLKTPQGNLRVERVPMPPPSDGKYRSYTNVLFANGVLVVPMFPELCDEYDRQALQLYRSLRPDLDVIGIDILELSTLGGGLHCLTAHVCPAARDRHLEPAKSGFFEPLVLSAAGMRRA